MLDYFLYPHLNKKMGKEVENTKPQNAKGGIYVYKD